VLVVLVVVELLRRVRHRTDQTQFSLLLPQLVVVAVIPLTKTEGLVDQVGVAV
jgi:hypothetical protein